MADDYYCHPGDLELIPDGIQLLRVGPNGTPFPDSVDYTVIPKSVSSLVLDHCGFDQSTDRLPDHLERLVIIGAKNSDYPLIIPEGDGSFRTLKIEYCKFTTLVGVPSTIKNFVLDACNDLVSICQLPPRMEKVMISSCRNLPSLDFLPREFVAELLIEDLNPVSLEGMTQVVGSLELKYLDLNELSELPKVKDLLSIEYCELERSFEILHRETKKVHLYQMDAEVSGLPQELESLTIISGLQKSLEGLPQGLNDLTLIEMEDLESYQGIPMGLKHLVIDQVPKPTDLPRLFWLITAAIDYAVTYDGFEYENGIEYMKDNARWLSQKKKGAVHS